MEPNESKQLSLRPSRSSLSDDQKKLIIKQQFSLFSELARVQACPLLGSANYTEADINQAFEDLSEADEGALEVANEGALSAHNRLSR